MLIVFPIAPAAGEDGVLFGAFIGATTLLGVDLASGIALASAGSDFCVCEFFEAIIDCIPRMKSFLLTTPVPLGSSLLNAASKPILLTDEGKFSLLNACSN